MTKLIESMKTKKPIIFNMMSFHEIKRGNVNGMKIIHLQYY